MFAGQLEEFFKDIANQHGDMGDHGDGENMAH
jgi:hypothetical protein